MSNDPKGSTPGPILERNQLTRVNTFPSCEFTIPPCEPPEQVVSKCPSHQTRSSGAQAPPRQGRSEECEEKNECPEDDGEAQSISSQATEISYPEGGLSAWLVVLGSFMGCVVAFGMMNTIGIFHAYLSEHQLRGYSESTTGWIFSVYVFLAFFGGIQIGPLFDTHGPRWLIVAGSISMCASMFLLGLCTRYWHFVIVFGVLGGVGTSLIFTPALSAVSHWFFRKRGTATGISAAGGSFGGIIFPLALQRMFPTLGFAWATRIVGFVFVFCCALAITLVRSRLPPKPGQKVMPDLRIFRDKSYLLLTIGIYFMEWALFVPIAYLTTFAISTGALTPAFSYQLIAIMNAGSCIGRWVPGYIADFLGRFNSMIAALAICAATTLTLWLPTALLTPNTSQEATAIKGLCIVYALIFGFASGSNISITPVCVGQLCATNDYGRYYATCYTLVSFGTLTGIPIAGSLIQAADGHYYAVVIWTLLCYVVSLGCFIWGRACRVGWKLGIKF